jgi:hypothetical protein
VRSRIATTLLLLLAAGLAAGCGADEESKRSIPAATAQELETRLDEVERRFDVGGGACADIENDSRPAVETILASLPPSVDRDERNALVESFDRLFELTAAQCDEEESSTTPTPTTETETTETETTETTETTDTTDTTTTPTETETTDTVPPPTTTPTTPDDGGTGGGGTSPEDDE